MNEAPEKTHSVHTVVPKLCMCRAGVYPAGIRGSISGQSPRVQMRQNMLRSKILIRHIASSSRAFWTTNNSHMIFSVYSVATQPSSGLSNTVKNIQRPWVYLKLCDSSVADLSSRGCIFTPIESFHFVIQFPNKVYLQGARAWETCGDQRGYL